MPQKSSRFSDAELDAAVAAGEDLREFAKRVGVTYGLVSGRLRKLRIARGEEVRESSDYCWDDKLRFQPTQAQIERLFRTHGGPAVEERWGRQYGDLRRTKACVGPSRRESVA